MASPNPLDPTIEDQLRLRFGMPVRTVLCTAAGITELLSRHYSREALEAADAAGPVEILPAAAGKKGESKSEGAAAKAAKADDQPLAPEQKKQRTQLTIVSFNFASALVATALYAGLGFGFWITAVAALSAGGIAALIAWNTAGKRG